MDRKIIVNCNSRETRVALLEDNSLVEIYMERPVQESLVGNIYKGKVANVLPGMQAAFVDIDQERNAFLFVDDLRDSGDEEAHAGTRPSIRKLLHPGEEIMVQVIKEGFGNKGPRLTCNITLPGRYLVLMPGTNYVGVSRRIEDQDERERLKKIVEKIRPNQVGVIVRTAAEGSDQEHLEQDINFLVQLWDKITQAFKEKRAPALLHQDLALIYRIVRDLFTDNVSQFIIDDYYEYKKVLEILDFLSPSLKKRVFNYRNSQPIFERFGIEKEIEESLDRIIRLSCGGYLVFDKTEALTVIDVNTGKYIGRHNLEDTILKTNLEAAAEIARQIRLRDIGGIIIVDFIDMNNPQHKEYVLETIKEHLKRDRTRAHVLGLTSLGLVEIARKKVRRGLEAVLQQTCPYCGGKGKVFTPEVASSRVERELKRYLEAEKSEAVLVEMNKEVASLLIGAGGQYLRQLEKETGKNIFIRGSDNVHLEKFNILLSGTLKEVKRFAFPVKEGDIYHVKVEEAHLSHPDHGISRLSGYIIDIEGAGKMVGSMVEVEIIEVTNTFARARLKQYEKKGEQL
ncbi:MAG: Rne/Rng family ribonuclease [Firmicutes bacterium]|nr:Rne/Rng family ribonuclease [Bacillota bacterium]